MKAARRAVVVGAFAFVAAACGDDDDTTEADATTTVAETAAPVDTTAAGTDTTVPAVDTTGTATELTEPAKVVMLVEAKGEGPSAVPYFADGAQLAVDEINAAGGVGGLELEYERISAPTDPAAAKTALQKAYDASPTGIVGFPSSGQAVPLAADVKAAGVPFIYLATAPQLLVGGTDSVNDENAFVIRPPNSSLAQEELQYMVDEGATKVALLCVDSPFGETGCNAVEEAADSLGVEIVAREKNGPTDTDLTAQVQAIASAGPDAVIAFDFPNPLGVFATQMIDNGVDVPIMGGASAALAIAAGGVTGPAATNLLGIDDCVPVVDPRPVAADFAEAFETEFGYKAGYGAAEAYDGIYLFKAAIEAAGSTEPAAVSAAMKELTFEGVCDPDYQADAGNGLHDRSYIETFAEDGTPTVVKEITFG